MANTTTLNETTRAPDGTESIRLATTGANWKCTVSALLGLGFTTLSGDLTANSAGAVTIANNAISTAKIANSAVTLAKLANIADATILGNNTGGAAAPVALTAAQTRTLLGLAAIATSGSADDLSAGTVASARLSGSYTGITGTGTLTAGATGAGFTVALSVSTITGTLGLARGGTNADLSATGGTSQVLKQSSTGAAITVGTLAASDLSNGTTGSGAVVLATSATLVTPALGTPSALVLTNATGLPVATGISGLGSGVATFLATPSSANLAAAVTGETGSGALVFGTAPTIAGGSITALTALAVRSTGSGAFDLTFANAEDLTAGRTLTFALGDAARTLTIGASASVSGSNTGDQTITLTGDVTGSGTGSFAATIANNAVTLAKMATVATATFLGRTTASTGNVEALTATQATALLSAFVGDSGSGGTKGLVPAPVTGDATKFLRGDATWATASATITGSDTLLLYFDGANNPAGAAGLAYNDSTQALTLTPAVNGVALTVATATHTAATRVASFTQTVNATGTLNLGLLVNVINGGSSPAADSPVIEYQAGGASTWFVRKDGALSFASNSVFYVGGSLIYAANPTINRWYTGGSGTAALDSSGLRVISTYQLGFAANTTPDTAPDAMWTRSAAATIQQGAANAASPVAQIYQAQGSRGGTDSNVGGGNFTIRSGAGTGTGTRSKLILQSPVLAASGTTAQTQTTGLTIEGGAATLASSTVANLPASPVTGMMAQVTDANTPAVGSAVASGGAAFAAVVYNGSQWTVFGI